MTQPADDLDLGDFDGDTPAPEVVATTAANADDLGDFDEQSIDAALAVLDAQKSVEAIMADAKLAAMTPKPKLDEMIAAVCEAANRIEDGQKALLNAGLRTEPYAPFMRSAAVLDAAQKFLTLIGTKQDAVRRVLRGG